MCETKEMSKLAQEIVYVCVSMWVCVFVSLHIRVYVSSARAAYPSSHKVRVRLLRRRVLAY